MIPLLHDFSGQTVLVFGGGSVGARKARRFVREANVMVVSPSFADADFGDAERVRESVDAEGAAAWIDRADPALVVAATDDGDLNAAIEDAARERGVLVNRTDVDGGRDTGSVAVPATVRDGPVTVAVATGGRSPALSKHLRERLEAEIDGAGAMAALSADLRRELKAEGVPPEERRDAVRTVVRDERVWKALDSGASNARQQAADVVADVTGDST